MQFSSYIVEREPLKYGGQQKDYQCRMQTLVSWGSKQIKEAPKDEKKLIELFFRLLEHFMQERQKIAFDHKTSCAEQFGRKRGEIGTKDFYQTILDHVYSEYNSKILTILADHLRGMSLESKKASQKHKRIEETHLGRLSSLEIEILESEDLEKLNWMEALTSSEIAPTFPVHLLKKLEVQGDFSSIEEWKIWKQSMRKLKEEHPVLYTRMKMTTSMLELQKEYPSPTAKSTANGMQLIGNEGNRKSFFALVTVRLQVKEKLYSITQYLTWLYRDFATHPVDRMLKYSTVMVMHQDNFLIDDTLQEIASIFAKAVLSNENNQDEFRQNMGLLRHYFANCMPCERGSSSLGELFEGSICEARDLEVKYNPKKQVDLESLTSPLLSIFMKDYESMVEFKPASSK